MPNGGNIFIQTKPLEDNFILIRIIDEGCGIPEDRIPSRRTFYSLKKKAQD